MKSIRNPKISYRLWCIPVCLCLLFLHSGCNRQEKPGNDPPPSPEISQNNYQGTIIALGDSLTAGLGVPEQQAYPAILQDMLHQAGYNWRVINAGISGETSSGALSRTNWIIGQQPDMVILETGANDGMRGIPPKLIKQNINRTVKLLQDAGVTVVLAGMQMLQNLGQAYTEEFAAVYPAVAREQEVILVPFFLEGVAGEPELNLPDGIHPTPAGHRIIARTVYPFAVQAIKSRTAPSKRAEE